MLKGQTPFSMAISLYPLPSLFDDNVLLLKQATPVLTSSAYLRRPYAVPWSVLPTTFVLETDEPDAVHTFVINNTTRVSVVPGAGVTSQRFLLVKGANRIEVSTPSQRTHVTIAATAIETWFRALGREYYLSVGRRLGEIETHFQTPWTTRISAHLLPFADLFLPARMPKIQQTRLAILTSTGRRLGYGDGVMAVASAVSYSTPWVSRARDAEFAVPNRDFLVPGVSTHPTAGELKGRVLDLWYPNHCLAAKLALTRLALNVGTEEVPAPKPISLVDFDDRQVLLRVNGGDVEVHTIDPLSPECADVATAAACDTFFAFGEMETVFDILMNSPQLPFDEVVEAPLLFGFWDMGFGLDESEGSGFPGLGGDDHFDSRDADDPFGDGFNGFSLSRRLDLSVCFDTRIQRGQALAKYVPPLSGTSSLTPDGDQAGTPLRIDAAAGAPDPALGNSIIWGVSPRPFLYEGDVVRFEEPDTELVVASAWPVFTGTDAITKSTSSATDASVNASQRQVGAPAGFFEARHRGMGLRVAGAELYCIVDVSDDGTTALIAGNPTALPGGSFIVNVYEPLHDRTQTDGAPFAGERTYEVTFDSPLLANIADQTVADYRPVPRISGTYLAGVDTFHFSSNVYPLPGDFLYLTTATRLTINTAVALGTVHPTTGMPIYEGVFTDVTGGPLAEGEALYSLSANPCYPNGDPVTPLTLISLAPSGYLTP